MSIGAKVGWTVTVVVIGVFAYGLLRGLIGAGHIFAIGVEVAVLFYLVPAGCKRRRGPERMTSASVFREPRIATFLMLFSLCTMPSSVLADGDDLFGDVIEAAIKCGNEKPESDVISCHVKATPSKCESFVYQLFSGGKTARSARLAWFLCITSCEDAGYISRTFGACSREIK